MTVNVTTTTTGRPDAPGRHKAARPVPYGRALALTAAATIAAALLAAPHATATHGNATEPYPDDRPRREACAHEGAPGPCLWDARHRGNGQGQSFLVRASGKVVPVSHRRAHAATRHAE